MGGRARKSIGRATSLALGVAPRPPGKGCGWPLRAAVRLDGPLGHDVLALGRQFFVPAGLFLDDLADGVCDSF